MSTQDTRSTTKIILDALGLPSSPWGLFKRLMLETSDLNASQRGQSQRGQRHFRHLVF